MNQGSFSRLKPTAEEAHCEARDELAAAVLSSPFRRAEAFCEDEIAPEMSLIYESAEDSNLGEALGRVRHKRLRPLDAPLREPLMRRHAEAPTGKRQRNNLWKVRIPG